MSISFTNQMRDIARAKLAALIEKEGIRPLDLETLKSMGNVRPEDENVDDFLEARERWRKESSKCETSLVTDRLPL